MKKLHITKSKKENYYFIDFDNKVIQLVHPELAKLYLEKTVSDVPSYYQEKKIYLENHIQFQNDNKNFELKTITSRDIEHNIITTSQIVFEITDKCNIKCKYCGYGELYSNYDERNTKDADINDAISLINYYFDLCKKYNYVNKNLSFGFYGGEPLIKFDFIKEIISYIEEKYPSNYLYNITTNGLLLKQYIDYFVEKKFNLLISLDGDEFSNSYRIDRNGVPTFNKVIENINFIRERYPSYYENNVSFNSVIHNRNKLEDVLFFFKKSFSKSTNVGRLNDCGINPDKIDLFYHIYTNISSFDYENITTEDIKDYPSLFYHHLRFLHNNLFSIYKDYLNLISDNKKNEIYPTATCSPFKKKIFLTVNGKILPCEKIGHNYCLGNVLNGITTINSDEIAYKFNEIYENIYNKQCSTCNLITNCSTCIFQSNFNCPIKGDGGDYFKSEMDFFESQTDLHNEMILNLTLR